MFLDLLPLKVSRDYRLLFTGQLVSFFGSMMTFIVVPWQMYQLTRSSAMVGYMNFSFFIREVLEANAHYGFTFVVKTNSPPRR